VGRQLHIKEASRGEYDSVAAVAKNLFLIFSESERAEKKALDKEKAARASASPLLDASSEADTTVFPDIEDCFERVIGMPDPNARCHILQAPMVDPVRLYRCGHLFEGKALIEWIRFPGAERPCPVCRERIWTKGECKVEREGSKRRWQLQEMIWRGCVE